jgi:hypothetical protein
MGMLLRLLVAFASYNGVVQALERGWVKAQSPADFRTEPFETNYNDPSWEAIDKIDPRELSQGKVVQNRGLGLDFVPADQMSDEDRLEQTRTKEWLAAQHGFFGSVYGRNISGNRAFLDTITVRTLRGMISSKDEYDMGDMSALFHSDPDEADPSMFGTSKLNNRHNLQTLMGHLLEIQGRVGNDVYATAVGILNRLRDRVGLKVLNHCLPGEKLNYLLKIH